MKKLIVYCCFFMVAFACNKQPIPATLVLLRIENKTTTDFVQVLTNSENFDSVHALSTTAYQSFNVIQMFPSAELRTTSDTIYISSPVPDDHSVIDNGKYTLQIAKDSISSSGYKCMYRKD